MCVFNYKYLDEKYVNQILELDASVYQSKDQVSRETLLNRLKRNPQTDIIMAAGDALIGYISLCPVSEHTFSLILNQRLSEDDIENAVIPYHKSGTYHAYLSSIVIDKKKFPRITAKALILNLQNHILHLRLRSVYIDKIIAKAVSIAGKKTLLKMNFKEIYEGMFIFSCFRQGVRFVSLINRSFSYNLSFVRIIEVARRGFV